MAPASGPAPAVAPARAAAAPPSPESEWELGLAALVGIGLIGGAAMMAANARRRRESLAAEHDAFEEATAAQAAAIAPGSAPVAVRPDAVRESIVPPSWEQTREGVAPPAPVVEAGDEPRVDALEEGGDRAGPATEDALRERRIEEMVAAPPDADNPFRSRKARRRRARNLLAQREAELREEASRPFDWAGYQASAQRRPTEPVN
ncbi:MAG: hypothetical protein KGM17_08960 [Sphingomonadales bacterium]|nr:hypothetical protein [Sphingomonadales bacterium]